MNNDNTFNGKINLKDYEKFAIKSFRDIRITKAIAKSERIVGIPICGDSLANIGIIHGDILIVKITDKHAEENLCVWETPNGRTAKFGYKNFDEIVLHNKADWKRVWKSSEAKLFGVVIRIERDL